MLCLTLFWHWSVINAELGGFHELWCSLENRLRSACNVDVNINQMKSNSRDSALETLC